jgi:hypothetical protein
MDSEFVAGSHPWGNSNPIDLRGTPAVGTSDGKGTWAACGAGDVYTDVVAATDVAYASAVAVTAVPYVPYASAVAASAAVVAASAVAAVDDVVRHMGVGDIRCIGARNGSGTHRSSTGRRWPREC